MFEQSRPLRASVKYNPHLWGDAELRAIFVVRQRELEAIRKRIAETKADTVPQHVLLVGARGMGKSSLLRRIALAVQDEPALATQWLALSFPEELYTVSTLAELWAKVLEALADRLEQAGAPAAECLRIDGEIQRIGKLPDAEQENAALEFLSQWIATNGRRIILLIDGVERVFSSLASTGARGKNAADATPLWRLRKTLSHHPGIMWIGASYQALEAQNVYADAFHDFFELVELRPLSVDDMRQTMLTLARTLGESRSQDGELAAADMAQILDRHPERLKILRTMTGGNPRTTVMLYELLANGWQEDIHTDIQLLLDALTPLYKARLEGLAEQPLKLLAHLMEHWAPMSAAALSEVSRIPVTTVSGQLTRLENEGFIEKAKLQGTRKTGFVVCERLFNAWYLMRYTSRRTRQQLAGLLEFMRHWYSSDALQAIALDQAGRPAAESDLEDASALIHLARASALKQANADATLAYRQALERLGAAAGASASAPLALQAQLWLKNLDQAGQTLDVLAQAALIDACSAFVGLLRQVWACHQIGLGLTLAGLMEASIHADFLRPMALALRVAGGEADALDGTPPELRSLAEEILQATLKAVDHVSATDRD